MAKARRISIESLATKTKDYESVAIGECELTLPKWCGKEFVTYRYESRETLFRALQLYRAMFDDGPVESWRAMQCIGLDCGVCPIWIDITNDIEQCELEPESGAIPMSFDSIILDGRNVQTTNCGTESDALSEWICETLGDMGITNELLAELRRKGENPYEALRDSLKTLPKD